MKPDGTTRVALEDGRLSYTVTVNSCSYQVVGAPGIPESAILEQVERIKTDRSYRYQLDTALGLDVVHLPDPNENTKGLTC